jgi:class 3 adenylate cyclase
MRPETQYARSGDAWIAYEVSGEGPVDLMMITGVTYPLDSHFDVEPLGRFIERLSTFARVIRYDRRWIGLSDHTMSEPPTLEQWVQDGLAVLDEVGSERATLFTTDGAGGQPAMLTAATHPDRVDSLVLTNPTPCPTRRDGWPHGTPAEEVDGVIDRLEEQWRTGVASSGAQLWDVTDDVRRALLRANRRGASPGGVRLVFRTWYATDVRPLLDVIVAPTLVLHRSEATLPLWSHDAVRYVANAIRDARYVELPGESSLIFLNDSERAADEIEEFVTGIRPASIDEDRVFAALLFTDIVSSTEHNVRVGDRRWKALLDRHDDLIRANLMRFRGRLVNPAGDGCLATFDGPARAVACARAIVSDMKTLGIDVRAGIHAGEVVVRGDDVTGVAVNIASRVADLAGPGDVLVSRTVPDLVAGSGITFEDRGTHVLKGVPDEWRIYAVRA